MSPRKKDLLSAVAAAAESSADTAKTSAHQLHEKTRLERIPPAVRFALAVFSSLVLSSTLFTLTTGITLGDLGRVSKHLETWWEVGGLMAWKAVEVGLAWVLGYDARDVLTLTLLTHLPTYTLLSTFYTVRPTTTITSYLITLISTTLPFYLLRPSSSLSSPGPKNRSILQDRPTTIYTTVAATAIFAVALYTSYATPWLPRLLVVHFANLPDISAVHAGPAGLPGLFLGLLPAGAAVRDFLFVSSAGVDDEVTSEEKKKKKKQNGGEGESEGEGESKGEGEGEGEGEGKSFLCALYQKTWGSLTRKTQVLVSRTVVLAGLLLGNTVVQVAGTVNGVDVTGAAAWGSVWAAAAVVTGALFGWVEAVDGV
ncbi:hypothetical protein BO70DRAFT_391875 [Aspergillus heteromorphus CBS 117.55]|uniref:Uncharacterized protein n=1 Tax=Aspergillus heteromorphus CBS 117.55 TaxID=1448321 RepID=A0A317X2U2_9EURO|nr:uncharacterized protein BO70DRAFT_391875 [Aspergillus heteromorphus CBS 117.55]PWY92471.1 hypothetical protein BO70DRAFT_391875 [Aspergillus heteromorphus CBS 117.55]